MKTLLSGLISATLLLSAGAAFACDGHGEKSEDTNMTSTEGKTDTKKKTAACSKEHADKACDCEKSKKKDAQPSA